MSTRTIPEITFFNSNVITWEEFNINQEKNSGSKVILKQTDFDKGTLRVKSSCLLELSEDISFNPNPGFGFKTVQELKGNQGNNWFPTSEQLEKDYDKHAYRLGFFAAIAIETSNVVFDLNSHIIEQSEEHRLMQRFFAVIELADQPFLPLTGPSNFGDSIDSASDVTIYNGTIGLSSHHGIHGNNNKNVLLKSLTFRDYEVAAVSMNGGVNITMDNIKLQGNNTTVPVLGTFSSLRFLDQFVIETLKHTKDRELNNKLRISILTQQQIYYKVIKNGKKLKSITSEQYQHIVDGFINTDGLVDGNSYGLLFNKPSVAVNEFSESIEEYKSTNITLKNITINNTVGKIKEIVTLNHIVNGELKPVVDTAGSVLQIDKIIDSSGCYKYSILSDYKMTLSKVANSLKGHYGTLYIPSVFYEWSKSDLPIDKFITYGKEDGCYTRTRNSDTMNHMNKGVTAIRVDGVKWLSINDVKITNTTNNGDHGIYDVEYHGVKDGGHFKQSGIEPNRGYMGADVRAIGLFSVSNLNLNNITIDEVTSYNGKSLGIDLQGVSSGINIVNNIKVDNILASSLYSKNTNKAFSCDIRVGYDVVVKLNNITSTHDKSGPLYIINNNMSTVNYNDPETYANNRLSFINDRFRNFTINNCIVIICLLLLWFIIIIIYSSGDKTLFFYLVLIILILIISLQMYKN